MIYSHSSIAIAPETLPADDLRLRAEGVPDARAYRVLVYTDHGRRVGPLAYMLHLPATSRTGIAWGAEALWGDSTGDLQVDIDTYLNHRNDWTRRS